ncbi:E3 ubiquitin-protein ligase NRDP1-like [Suncus etruscus]|uniref:E3 ubiquitin-protein ligase NRDP1-like n=1 Tax=Suncus etruscus TaxID=109475 RepID=UPI0021106DA1|nr:E3 ubiquitin-protein ligase NRDP1-like [Suncus etruscus]
MGYDITRFQGVVDEDLICPICRGVLDDPIQAIDCEHAFCKVCISQRFTQQHTCPVDQSVLIFDRICPVPRIMLKMLAKLMISCDNAVYGCRVVTRLDNLVAHFRDCEYNPKRPVTCDRGCNLVMANDELPQHNCIKHLHFQLEQQQKNISELEKISAEQKKQLVEQKQDLRDLKAYMRVLNMRNPTFQQDEIWQWVYTLQPAKVTQWDCIISTPDAMLKVVLRRSLVETGCPTSFVNQLMENSQEHKWPQGLATLEMRQMNQHYYENYVTRHILGLQAVLMMAYENQHMDENMVREPGIIIMFGHGVEDLLDA